MADRAKPEAVEGGSERKPQPTAPYSGGGMAVLPAEDLSGEIALLRRMIQDLYERARREDLDFDTWQRTVGVLSAACTRLAGLIRMQVKLEQGRKPDTAEIMSRALEEALKELGI